MRKRTCDTSPPSPLQIGYSALHKYEAVGHVVPTRSYTRGSFPHSPRSARTSPNPHLGAYATYAQTWDLFSHMRYVAHPMLDAHLSLSWVARVYRPLYMCRPERELDLWAEMQKNWIEPSTRAVYEVIILVFGSGTKVGGAVRWLEKYDRRCGGREAQRGQNE